MGARKFDYTFVDVGSSLYAICATFTTFGLSWDQDSYMVSSFSGSLVLKCPWSILDLFRIFRIFEFNYFVSNPNRLFQFILNVFFWSTIWIQLKVLKDNPRSQLEGRHESSVIFLALDRSNLAAFRYWGINEDASASATLILTSLSPHLNDGSGWFIFLLRSLYTCLSIFRLLNPQLSTKEVTVLCINP